MLVFLSVHIFGCPSCPFISASLTFRHTFQCVFGPSCFFFSCASFLACRGSFYRSFSVRLFLTVPFRPLSPSLSLPRAYCSAHPPFGSTRASSFTRASFCHGFCYFYACIFLAGLLYLSARRAPLLWRAARHFSVPFQCLFLSVPVFRPA